VAGAVVADVAVVEVAVDVEVLVQKVMYLRMITRKMKDRLSHSKLRTPLQKAPPKSPTELST